MKLTNVLYITCVTGKIKVNNDIMRNSVLFQIFFLVFGQATSYTLFTDCL